MQIWGAVSFGRFGRIKTITEDTAPHPAVSAAPLPCDALAAERTLVMGILNVTPDSFSDGGQHYAATDAIAHSARMIAEGASIIDIGGESARPGAVRISVEEEQRRILPVIEAVAQMGTTISVDTMNPQTARAAIAAEIGRASCRERV